MTQSIRNQVPPAETTIDVEAEGLALDLFCAATGLSRNRMKDAMTKGAAWLTRAGKQKRIRRAKALVLPGDRLTLYFDENVLKEVGPKAQLIADERDYSVWYKPAGLLSSGTRFGDHCAINRQVEQRMDRPVFLVHRLDQFASGLMVLAHSKSGAARLSLGFQTRNIEKRYQALVRGALQEPCTITAVLDGKGAVSHVKPLAFRDNLSLVEISIETGRKHQIRRHLAGLGHPVVGDRQYGQDAASELQLTAVFLAFDNKEGVRVSYQLPEAFHPRIPALNPLDPDQTH